MEVSSQLQLPAALLTTKRTLISVEQKAGWNSEQVRTLWKREKYLAPTGNRTTILCKSNPDMYLLHRQKYMQTSQKSRYLRVQFLNFCAGGYVVTHTCLTLVQTYNNINMHARTRTHTQFCSLELGLLLYGVT